MLECEMPSTLEISLDGAHQNIAAQLSTASSLDAKLSMLVAFVAALIAVLLSIPKGLADTRWILLASLGLAALVCLIGSVMSDDLTDGPQMVRYYTDYGGLTPQAFMAQLLADLGQAIDENEALIQFRRWILSSAFGIIAIGAVVYGLVRALI